MQQGSSQASPPCMTTCALLPTISNCFHSKEVQSLPPAKQLKARCYFKGGDREQHGQPEASELLGYKQGTHSSGRASPPARHRCPPTNSEGKRNAVNQLCLQKNNPHCLQNKWLLGREGRIVRAERAQVLPGAVPDTKTPSSSKGATPAFSNL